MSKTVKMPAHRNKAVSRFGQYLDRLEQTLGNGWPGVVVGAFIVVALLPALPALSPLLRYRINVPLPLLAALGVVIAGHELAGWCWHRKVPSEQA